MLSKSTKNQDFCEKSDTVKALSLIDKFKLLGLSDLII